MKKNSSICPGWTWKRTSGYLDRTLSMRQMPFWEISVSASGSGAVSARCDEIVRKRGVEGYLGASEARQ